jgi:P4 family phage/plasmid primase-like protien
MAICGRAPVTVDDHWKEFGTSKDGRTKYRLEKEQQKTYTPPQTREWIYTDSDGNPIAKEIRIDREAQDKQIFRNYYINGQWLNNIPDSFDKKEFTSRIAPLYWDEVDRAIARGELVFICEGETTTDAVRKLGLTSTTFIGGKWDDCCKEYFIGAKVVLCPDADFTGIKEMDRVAEGIKDYAESIQWLYAYPDRDYIWDNALNRNGGGLDLKDYLQQYPTMAADDLKQQIEETRRKLEAKFGSGSGSQRDNADHSDDGGKRKKREIPKCGTIANRLIEKYRHTLAWDTSIQQWRRYEATRSGVWDKEVSEFVRQVIYAEIEAMDFEPEDITPSLVKSTEELLQWKLAVRKWDVEDLNLLPMTNGVLKLDTQELLDHSPNYRLTWSLPFAYDPLATCNPIKEWLLETCGGDVALMNLILCYLYGIVTGRTDWQKFIELIGPGGTGKSTLIRLAIALLGQCNVHTTTLHKLEGSRFETANIKDKRLVVITDSERYSGEVTTLKALTGQDSLPYEVKFQQSTGGFIPHAMVMVAANEMIQSGDYTSGLKRRRMTVPFNNRVEPSQQRNLIELGEDNQVGGEFVDYLPGLLNLVLSINPDKATSLVKDYTKAVPALKSMEARSLCDCNPIADWADNKLVYRPDEKTQIGVARRDKDTNSGYSFIGANYWLYASYCEYATATGSKPIGLRRFVNLLDDLCTNQLNLEGVYRHRDQRGRFFIGLKIRTHEDCDPCLITGDENHSQDDGSMTDNDGFHDGLMTDETPGNAKLCWNDGSIRSLDSGSEKMENRNETIAPPPTEGNNGNDPSSRHNSASVGDSASTDPSSDPSSPVTDSEVSKNTLNDKNHNQSSSSDRASNNPQTHPWIDPSKGPVGTENQRPLEEVKTMVKDYLSLHGETEQWTLISAIGQLTEVVKMALEEVAVISRVERLEDMTKVQFWKLKE